MLDSDDEMLEAFRHQVSREEGDGDVAGEQPAQDRAEVEGGEAFEPTQVDFAFAIDTVQEACQPAVETQERVATDEVLRIGQVRQLELVARDGIAQIAEREEPVSEDAVEQFLHHFEE